MPTIIVTHEVTDTDHWLASQKREELLPSLGASNLRTFVNPQDRTKVGLVMDVADLDVLFAVLGEPIGRADRGHEVRHGSPRDDGDPGRILNGLLQGDGPRPRLGQLNSRRTTKPPRGSRELRPALCAGHQGTTGGPRTASPDKTSDWLFSAGPVSLTSVPPESVFTRSGCPPTVPPTPRRNHRDDPHERCTARALGV